MTHRSTPSERSPLLSNQINEYDTVSADDAIDGAGVDSTAVLATDLEQRPVGNTDAAAAAQYDNDADAQRRLKLIIPAVGIGVFLAAADSTIILSSYASIGSSLHSLNLTPWVATAYFLSLTSFQPLYGRLSDIFGRKECLLFAYTVFGAGTLACGLSPSMGFLIAARIVEGIGGGGMTTVVSILFSDIVPLKDRGLWQGIINIVFAAGSAGGASLGGILSDAVGWRWCFLGQVPLCVLAIVSVALILENPNTTDGKKEGEKWTEKLKRVDFLGAVFLVVAVFSLLFGLDRGSNVGWRTPLCYGSLGASVLLFTIFVLVETKIAKEPFTPGRIILKRNMIAAYMCYFFSFGSWLAVLYYLPLFYQAVDGMSASEAAIRLLPAIFATVAGSLFGGFVMKRVGRYYWLSVTSFAVMTVGLIITFLFIGTVTNSTFGTSAGIFLAGFSNGIGMTTCLIALIANAAPEDQATATACSYLFRSLGSAIGISLSSTITQEVLHSNLNQQLGSSKKAAEIQEGVRQSLDYIWTLSPEVQKIVRIAYSDAGRHGFVLKMVAAFGAFVASIFLIEKKLSR